MSDFNLTQSFLKTETEMPLKMDTIFPPNPPLEKLEGNKSNLTTGFSSNPPLEKLEGNKSNPPLENIEGNKSIMTTGFPPVFLKPDYATSIAKLYEKYKDDDYMLQRINNHILIYLPNTLEHESKNHEKRQNMFSYLSEEQQIFMQVFLSKNNYYYLPNNCFYYEYNGQDYYIVKEDDIIHQLLSTISKDRILLQWKHKTKFNIIKQINKFTKTIVKCCLHKLKLFN